MLKLENVATPLTAATLIVPDSVALPGFAPSATVTVPVKSVATLPWASRAVTCTAGVSAAPAAPFGGCTVNASCVAAPAVTVTTAVWVAVIPPTAAVTVFDPATVEVRLPVATPFASVGAAGCVSVFPVPVAVSTTAAPLTGLPAASRAVTVIVAAPLPAVITVGAATTVDCVAEIVPATTLKAVLVAPLSPAVAAVSV